jgi:hypothetical protein
MANAFRDDPPRADSVDFLYVGHHIITSRASQYVLLHTSCYDIVDIHGPCFSELCTHLNAVRTKASSAPR